jgi:hypothetical protein
LKTWYVAFSKHPVTVMRLVKDRGEAIALACDLLDRGIKVTGAGPMVEMSQQEIGPASLREIWQQRPRNESRRAPIGMRAIVS